MLLRSGSMEEKQRRMGALFTFWWWVWKERNGRIFEGKERSAMQLAQIIQDEVRLQFSIYCFYAALCRCFSGFPEEVASALLGFSFSFCSTCLRLSFVRGSGGYCRISVSGGSPSFSWLLFICSGGFVPVSSLL
jgi:hypothetical protein